MIEQDFQIDNPKFWTKALWDYFKPLVKDGVPFYLAVDERLLKALVTTRFEEVQNFQDNIDSFHNACRKLLSFERGWIKVKEETFLKNKETGYSSVICLAAQQVLVVESMLRDDNYSEHSYFPRYRKILKRLEGNMNSNPLSIVRSEDNFIQFKELPIE